LLAAAVSAAAGFGACEAMRRGVVAEWVRDGLPLAAAHMAGYGSTSPLSLAAGAIGLPDGPARFVPALLAAAAAFWAGLCWRGPAEAGRLLPLAIAAGVACAWYGWLYDQSLILLVVAGTAGPGGRRGARPLLLLFAGVTAAFLVLHLVLGDFNSYLLLAWVPVATLLVTWVCFWADAGEAEGRAKGPAPGR
jgi:hypothetical protein